MLQLNKNNVSIYLNRYSITELEDIIQKHPYFKQAHVLLAKKYQQANHPLYDEQLQLAALYVDNRELLFDLFTETDETSPLPSDIALSEKGVGEKAVELSATATPEKNVELTVIGNVADEVVAPMELESVENEILVTELSLKPDEPALTITEVLKEEPVKLELESEVETEQTIVELEVVSREMNFVSASHTFAEWLHEFNLSKQAEIKPVPATETVNDEIDTIIRSNVSVDLLHNLVKEETHYSKGLDSFIEQQKDKRRQQSQVSKPAEAEIDPALVTETLAMLYERQKKYPKAIQAYKALTLKYPEKSDLFAARINYLKNII